jgi:hypothetical protein
MEKWTYKVIQGKTTPDSELAGLVDGLEAFGSQGWELVAILAYGYENEKVVLFLKLRIPD